MSCIKAVLSLFLDLKSSHAIDKKSFLLFQYGLVGQLNLPL